MSIFFIGIKPYDSASLSTSKQSSKEASSSIVRRMLFTRRQGRKAAGDIPGLEVPPKMGKDEKRERRREKRKKERKKKGRESKKKIVSE